PTPIAPRSSQAAPEAFVVLLYRFAKPLRHRIAIDRHHRVAIRRAAEQLLSDVLGQLAQRPGDRLFDLIPLRRLRVPAELATGFPSALADPRRLGTQCRIFDHLFDVAQPIGPLAVAFTGQRRRRPDPAAPLLSALCGPAQPTGLIELFEQTFRAPAAARLLAR